MAVMSARLQAESRVRLAERAKLRSRDVQLRVLLARLDAEEFCRSRAEATALRSTQQANRALKMLQKYLAGARPTSHRRRQQAIWHPALPRTHGAAYYV